MALPRCCPWSRSPQNDRPWRLPASARARGVVAVSYFHNDVEAGTQQLGCDQSPGGTCGASESGFKINGAFTAPTANAGAGVVVEETGL